MDENHAWVFVSHASADLARVREVRNLLEARGTSPLLFHLKSLRKPNQFWPLIKREIAERNFFLYCDSEAAEASEWVARERREVEAARMMRPIRLGRIKVDGERLDTAALDDFVSDINAYISYTRRDGTIVNEYCAALERSGFNTLLDYESIAVGTSIGDAIDASMRSVAENGWFLAFISAEYVRRGWSGESDALLRLEFEKASQYGRKLVPIVLEKEVLTGPIGSAIAKMQYFDATRDSSTAPRRLARYLLAR